MTYIMALFLAGLVAGLVAVASNPSPYFAALGLVVVAGMGCGALLEHGGSFLSLVLFLIYLGGMLVVFAYSAALAAEPFPKSWGSGSVMPQTALHVLGVGAGGSLAWAGWYEMSLVPADELGAWSVSQGDTGGVASLYLTGGGMLVLGAWALLVTLVVVLEVTRGLSRGVLRAV